MDDKLILLEAHKQGIKLNRPRKFYKTGQKGKAIAHIYKPDCSPLKINTMIPDELKRYNGPGDEDDDDE